MFGAPNNENYYNQITKAILDNDTEIFKNTINKYEVKYLLLDNSVIYPWGDKNLLKLNAIENFATKLGYKVVYKKDVITIYDTNLSQGNFLKPINSYTSINANSTYSTYDTIFKKYENYVEDPNGLGLPFVNFDNRENLKISTNEKEITISNPLTNSKVIFPISEKIIENFAEGHGFQDVSNCHIMKLGSVERHVLDKGRKYIAKDSAISCDYFVFDKLNYNSAQILHVKGENIAGRALKIYLYNWESKRVELEELLPNGAFDSYYILYPKNTKGSGYTLNVETRSFGSVASENIVDTIEFIPFDINFVQDLYIDSKLSNNTTVGNLEIISSKKFGTSIYKVETKGEGLLELGQGYDNGWISYPKLEHVKVNSWANGFKINNDGTYYIFFWPQLLEWSSFLLLLLTFVYAVVKSKK